MNTVRLSWLAALHWQSCWCSGTPAAAGLTLMVLPPVIRVAASSSRLVRFLGEVGAQ